MFVLPTLEKIRNRVKSKLNTVADVGGEWGDELNNYINEAQIKVACDLPECAIGAALTGITTHPVAATPIFGFVTIPCPEDTLRLMAVCNYAGGTKLRSGVFLPHIANFRARMEITSNLNSAQGTFFWTIKGNAVACGPTAEGDQIVIDYIKIPAPLNSNSDTPSVPFPFIYLIEAKAVFLALAQKGHPSAEGWNAYYRQCVLDIYQRYSLEPPRAFIDVPEKK